MSVESMFGVKKHINLKVEINTHFIIWFRNYIKKYVGVAENNMVKVMKK